MFQIGENIIYPMQGAGTIKAVEEKEISGQKQLYYVIEMAISNMQITIPKDKILSSNIRPVTDIVELNHIIQVFQHEQSEEVLPWKQRYTLNTTKVTTGSMQDCAEVVRDLSRLKKEKALNTSEKEMLDHAQKFLRSELKLIKGITEDQLNIFS